MGSSLTTDIANNKIQIKQETRNAQKEVDKARIMLSNAKLFLKNCSPDEEKHAATRVMQAKRTLDSAERALDKLNDSEHTMSRVSTVIAEKERQKKQAKVMKKVAKKIDVSKIMKDQKTIEKADGKIDQAESVLFDSVDTAETDEEVESILQQKHELQGLDIQSNIDEMPRVPIQNAVQVQS